jgi:hypothetical protein
MTTQGAAERRVHPGLSPPQDMPHLLPGIEICLSLPGTIGILTAHNPIACRVNEASWHFCAMCPKCRPARKSMRAMRRRSGSPLEVRDASETQNFYPQPITLCMIMNVCKSARRPSVIELIGTNGSPVAVCKLYFWLF